MKAKAFKSISKIPRKLFSPDLTAFIDLGFLLITFFMYSIYLSKPTTMNLNMPERVTCGHNFGHYCGISNNITLILGKDNRFFWHQQDLQELDSTNLNETNYSSNGLRIVLAEIRNMTFDSATFTVVIKPSNESNFKNTVDVLDEMAISGVSRYAIVDISPDEELAYKKTMEMKTLALK
jgi:biopolymer transport protein ExbD